MRRSACIGLLLPALMGLALASEDETDEFEMENEALAKKGSGLHHKFGCYEEQDPWKGSCDITEDGKVKHRADWSPDCDPWKAWKQGSTEEMNHSFEDWTCPEEYRSKSGCGDMRTDPRELKCENVISFNWTRSERIVIENGEPLVPMKHVCVQHPIFYDNVNTAGKVAPPVGARHRPRWVKWGEYQYLPPQRWLHSIEHGAIGFLYDHCLDEESVCLIRRFIRKWERKFEKSGVRDNKFRWIMTPFRGIMRPFGMVSWGSAYLSRGFNEWEMDRFVHENYRHAWEDYSPDGPYDYLWVNISEQKHTCSVETIEKAKKAMFVTPDFLNPEVDSSEPPTSCWEFCGEKAGFCTYCGHGGACCRKGHKWQNEADECKSVPAAEFPDGRHHYCVAVPPTPSELFSAERFQGGDGKISSFWPISLGALALIVCATLGVRRARRGYAEAEQEESSGHTSPQEEPSTEE